MKRIENPVESFGVLQRDLNTISVWSKQWLVSFNAQKTVYMLFSLKKHTPKYPQLTFEGTDIKLVTHHCHLGINLVSSLTWHYHINNICTKAHKVINMLKRIRHLVPRSSIECAYRTLALPILEYSSIVYDNASNDLSNKLEKVQRAAALLCTGAYRNTSYEKLLAELGWESLKTRRKYQRLTAMYKIRNGLTPGYLRKMMPSPSGQITNYTLRNAKEYRVPFCRTERYKQSFLPLTLTEWNALPLLTKGIPTLNLFKTELKKLLFVNRPNKLYRIGQSQVNKYHTWLRLGLSPLKEHLYTHHIIEQRQCTFCSNEPESTQHYFTTCPTFAHHRLELMKSLRDIIGDEVSTYSKQILTDLLLFGNPNLPFSKNKNIFKATHTYIIRSKRFIYQQSSP
jgi:hypothetical protein